MMENEGIQKCEKCGDLLTVRICSNRSVNHGRSFVSCPTCPKYFKWVSPPVQASANVPLLVPPQPNQQKRPRENQEDHFEVQQSHDRTPKNHSSQSHQEEPEEEEDWGPVKKKALRAFERFCNMTLGDFFYCMDAYTEMIPKEEPLLPPPYAPVHVFAKRFTRSSRSDK